jgi:hypothetical protein
MPSMALAGLAPIMRLLQSIVDLAIASTHGPLAQTMKCGPTTLTTTDSSHLHHVVGYRAVLMPPRTIIWCLAQPHSADVPDIDKQVLDRHGYETVRG